MEYRMMSDHPEDLDDGRVLEPGEFVDLDDETLKGDRVKQLVKDKRLVTVAKLNSKAPEVTDAALKLAKKEGVDLASVKGTGSDGQILVGDVEAAAEKQKGGDSK